MPERALLESAFDQHVDRGDGDVLSGAMHDEIAARLAELDIQLPEADSPVAWATRRPRARTPSGETVEQTTKTVIDWSAYFRRDGEPRLVLVTCGGEWDAQRQSYDDNVTVTARLVGS